MYPYMIMYGGWSIPAYPLIYGVAIACAGIALLVMAFRERLDVCRVAHVFLFASLAIIVGGRMAYLLQHSDRFASEVVTVFDLSSPGQVLYGGLLLCIPTVALVSRWLSLPVARMADLFAVAAPLGLVIGRWACFCRGCCYGKVTNLPWAIQYPKHVDVAGTLVGPPVFISQVKQGVLLKTADCTLSVHPAPVYASIVSLFVFCIMLWFWRSGRFQGRLVIIYPMLYALSRFALDFTREYKMAFWGFTISQVVSILVFVAGLTIMLRTSATAREV